MSLPSTLHALYIPLSEDLRLIDCFHKRWLFNNYTTVSVWDQKLWVRGDGVLQFQSFVNTFKHSIPLCLYRRSNFKARLFVVLMVHSKSPSTSPSESEPTPSATSCYSLSIISMPLRSELAGGTIDIMVVSAHQYMQYWNMGRPPSVTFDMCICSDPVISSILLPHSRLLENSL